jgi:RimJ/RimL family protein N-acetyltransferase
MRLVIGQDAIVSSFVSSLIPFEAGDFGQCTTVGVDRGGCLIGGFVFNNWSPGAGVIEVSFAGIDKRWLTRQVLFAAFTYAFDQLGCQVVCSRTPASLKHAARIAHAYGFKQVTVPRLFGRNEDGILSTLTVEDWRANGFHKENAHGQEKRTEAA